MAQIPKGRFVKGPYKPICRDCAIYFSTTVIDCACARGCDDKAGDREVFWSRSRII